MIVYHGSSIAVQHPDVCHSYRALDFGKGFYVTTVWKQAERWAKRKADLTGSGHAVVSQYQMSDALSAFRVKTYPKVLNEWIDFVCSCRDGKDIYLAYDVIIGKVANDKGYVSLWHLGPGQSASGDSHISRLRPDCFHHAGSCGSAAVFSVRG